MCLFHPTVSSRIVIPVCLTFTTGLWTGLVFGSGRVNAQVIPDRTLPTVVTPSGNTFTIDGGARSGSNLFHSFSQFSVPTGGAAIFNNAIDVQNIFSRVTGSVVSNIDGLIQANGTANLFLLNPNGILFGPNAALNIGGSFVGTTADSIKFADGVEFSAVNVSSPPLLTMSVPIGLQMGDHPGAIQVNGPGHRLVSPSATLTPYVATGANAGLKVQPGNTLALVGGEIDLVGATLTAERGRVELGSVGQQEYVGLNASTPALKLAYETVKQFSNISLSQRSLVDVSGVGAGSIQVQGQQVRLTDGSLLFEQNRGPQTAGDITIRADALEVIGGIAATNIRSAIVNETRSGNTGNISVTTRTLQLSNGGSLFNRSFGAGASGNIYINASESVNVVGYLAANSELFSAIGTVSFSPLPTGRSGTIAISTPILALLDSGIITAATFGNAAAGNISVNANQIEVVGIGPSSFGPSAISSSSFGKGNAGSITINTDTLLLQALGTINTTSSNSGDAGSIIVNASKSIEVTGGDSLRISNINSAISPANSAVKKLLGLPNLLLGNAGSITINTPFLQVSDQASIAVRNRGIGNSGKLTITADQIALNNQAQITAENTLGEGGNIALQAQTLILRHGSNITATAGGTGNGGNITINAPIIIGLENSDIIADAVRGSGGNIAITTQGIFGLKYRDQLTPASDITASSEFGVNGTVDIATPGIDPSSGLLTLPVELVDPSQQIAQGCAAAQGNSFTITGRGGMLENPTTQFRIQRPWADLRHLTPNGHAVAPTPIAPLTPPPLLEATGWHRNGAGQVELFAATQSTTLPTAISATCARAISAPRLAPKAL